MSEVTLDHPQITALLRQLSLEDKVRLLTGKDFWSTWPLESIGLRSIVVSDGPSGVRGPVWDERSPSLNLPSATALASSWDPAVAYRYGAVVASEARRKGVDVVLGPTVNLHRSPLGGRHFEAYSEDPLLTGELAAAFVRGAQDAGVGATPKHYVANDWETERFTASAEVSVRALRELYLLAFEHPVQEARAWVVMSAYNSINGITASEHPLLDRPLKGEWDFDGVVISDWGGVRSVASAQAEQDLAMPGPDGPWAQHLLEAVRAGLVPEKAVDRKVQRLLLLAARVGAVEGFPPRSAPAPVSPTEARRFAREAAIEGMVLLKNEGVLPVVPGSPSKIAVIGQNADQARTQGGGSATVVPEHVVSPLAGIRAAYPGAEVTYCLGAVAQEGLSGFPLKEIANPVTGEPGALVRFLDADRQDIGRENRRSTALVYFGGDAPIEASTWMEISLTWTPGVTGEVDVGFMAAGHGQVYLDGDLVLEDTLTVGEDQPGASLLHPPASRTTVRVEAGRPLPTRMLFDMRTRDLTMPRAFAITLGTAPAPRDPRELIAEAVSGAGAADLAVVVVGTSNQVESEGFDRTSLLLPGRQDELVAAVADTGTPTVVAVNSGSPVEMPWRTDVGAVMLTYFGGQEMGNALAEVLTGAREPGGRLPTSWPARLDGAPVVDVTPRGGRLPYSEDIHVGYRAWLRHDTEPAYWFGHGLGYTSWEIAAPTAATHIRAGEDLTVEFTVTNVGGRAGKHVPQVYLSRAVSDVERPVRWFAGNAVVRAAAGESVPVQVVLAARRFAHWTDGGGWAVEPGAFTVTVGQSVVDLAHELTVVVDPAQ